MRGKDLVRLSAVLGGEDQGTVGIKAGQHPEPLLLEGKDYEPISPDS